MVAPVPGASSVCSLQLPPASLNSHAAPSSGSLSDGEEDGPPISAVSPSPASATLTPSATSPAGCLPISAPPCWDHVEPERVKTNAAPGALPPDSSFFSAPTSAVLPLADSDTLEPCAPFSVAPAFATSFLPCCSHLDPDQVNTHAAP